jgi:selenophosphate synthase
MSPKRSAAAWIEEVTHIPANNTCHPHNDVLCKHAGAVSRNLESYGQSVDFDAAMPTWQQHLVVDPQTSGGLLVCVAPEAAAAVLQMLHDAGCSSAAVIGQLEEGEPRVRVMAAAPDN